jgi:sulfate/thiosulfate transport system permease protein
MAIRADALNPAHEAPPVPRGRRRFRVRPLSFVSSAGGSVVLVGYLSIVILIPVAALVAHGFGFSVLTHGRGPAIWAWSVRTNFSAFWSAVTQSQAIEAIWLSVWLSLCVAAVNAVMGIAIAWVLVRDDFFGKRFVEGIIDLPFALPTIVAGLVLLFLYGASSPVHVDLFESVTGLFVALLFVTLPFSVRSVQPVLESLDGQAEAAARSLGAGRTRTFFTVVLPSILPATLGGFGLAFARAVGEFGAIALIAGGLQRTTLAPYYIFDLLAQGPASQDEAAAVSVALLSISLVVLAASSAVGRHVQRRLSA